MEERRQKWVQFLDEEALEKRTRQDALMLELEEVKQKIRGCGRNYELYCSYKQKEMEIIAKLAAL